jgi:hypothetical protein
MSIDNDTLQVILGRFDKLDEKFDNQVKEMSNLTSRVVAVETKLEPIVDDAKFKGRVLVLTHAVTGAIAAGIVLAIRTIWPAHVAPPSILGK